MPSLRDTPVFGSLATKASVWVAKTPSMDDVQAYVRVSLSRSHDAEASNATSAWDGKTLLSSGELHRKNGAWLESGSKQGTMRSWSRVADVLFAVLSYPQEIEAVLKALAPDAVHR